jgi:branched-subunit amino acid transport protein
MSTAWIVILGLFAGVYVLKATGPLLLGERRLPSLLQRAATLLPAALLGALVATSTLAVGRSLHPDARVFGVAAAAIALWRKQSFVVVVLVAAAATATARAIA